MVLLSESIALGWFVSFALRTDGISGVRPDFKLDSVFPLEHNSSILLRAYLIGTGSQYEYVVKVKLDWPRDVK